MMKIFSSLLVGIALVVLRPLEVYGAQEGPSDDVCSEQLEALLLGLNKKEPWALRLQDAWGKWPSGLFSGNQYDFGNYDQCREYSYNREDIAPIVGQYCMVIVPNMELDKRVLIDTQGINGVVIGMCFPNTCSEEYLRNPINQILEAIYNITTNNTQLHCITKPTYPQPGRNIAIVTFSTIFAIIVVSTIYEITTLIASRKPKLLFATFSLYSGWLNLIRVTKPPPTAAQVGHNKSDIIECIHGVRVLAILWIVFGHSYLLINSSPLINSIAILKWLESFHSSIIIGGPLSVDTFFLLSGLLTCWSVMKELDRARKINVTLMYLHRYLRLTPALAALILFTVGILPQFGTGPLWNTSLGLTVDSCEKYWWSALLYVQNYVNPDQICLGHSWYLSVDMQLYLLSPILIYPLWRWGPKILIVVGLLILTSISFIFTMFLVYDFRSNILVQDLKRDNYTYLPTHTRMGAWMIGLTIGYVMYKTNDKTVPLPKAVIVSGWILSALAMITCIAGAHALNQPNYANQSNPIWDALYESLKHVLWAASVGWIVFACANGYGGPVNTILSSASWQPLGRLSYCVYLLHLPIQTMLAASTRVVRHFSDLQAVHTFWGDLGFTVMVAVLWTLSFEIPFGKLDTLLVRKAKKHESREDH